MMPTYVHTDMQVSKHLEERISEMNKRGKYFDKINYINEKISNFEKQLNEMENGEKCKQNILLFYELYIWLVPHLF